MPATTLIDALSLSEFLPVGRTFPGGEGVHVFDELVHAEVIDPDSGEYYCFLETMGGGYGGRFSSDGPDAVQCHGKNTENAPIEETETSYPVRIARYELIENSEGPGRFRGGLGLRRDYLFVDHEVSFTVLADRNRWGCCRAQRWRWKDVAAESGQKVQ